MLFPRNFLAGDIVRYASGPTALMRIEYIDGQRERAYGKHCMGGSTSASIGSCIFASKHDLSTFAKNAHWRDEGIWPSHLPLIVKEHGRWHVIDRVSFTRYNGSLLFKYSEYVRKAREFTTKLNQEASRS